MFAIDVAAFRFISIAEEVLITTAEAAADPVEAAADPAEAAHAADAATEAPATTMLAPTNPRTAWREIFSCLRSTRIFSFGGTNKLWPGPRDQHEPCVP